MKQVKIKISRIDEKVANYNIGVYVAKYLYINKILLNHTAKLAVAQMLKKAKTSDIDVEKIKIKIMINRRERETLATCFAAETRKWRKKFYKMRLEYLEGETLSLDEVLAYYAKENPNAADDVFVDAIEQNLLALKKFSPEFLFYLAKEKQKDDGKDYKNLLFLKKLVQEAAAKGYSKAEMLDAWPESNSPSKGYLAEILQDLLGDVPSETLANIYKARYISLVKKMR